MKCSGGPEPCHRCARFGRHCVFEPPSVASVIVVQPPVLPTGHASPSAELSCNAPTVQNLPVQRSQSPSPQSDTPSAQATTAGLVGQQPPAKRQRLNESEGGGPVHQESHPHVMLNPETPYSAVQDLEGQHESWSQSHPSHTPRSDGGLRHNAASADECLTNNHGATRRYAYLEEAGIPILEAEQMFMLFGERISHFIPSLYTIDFSKLPTNPILGLAALHGTARHLPDSLGLRSRLCRVLRGYLRDVIFENPDRESSACTETMQGLTIIYSCCEATGPGHQRQTEQNHPDILTAKAMAEGYALKMKLGGLDRGKPDNMLPHIWWLWLYTMSHQ